MLPGADAADALEGRAERERAAVADLVGNGADRGVRLKQQVAGERDRQPVRKVIGGSPTSSWKRRASAALEAPVSRARSATVHCRAGLFCSSRIARPTTGSL